MRWKIPRRHFHDIFAADEYSLVETWLDTQRYPTLYVFISRLRCHNSATERERERNVQILFSFRYEILSSIREERKRGIVI